MICCGSGCISPCAAASSLCVVRTTWWSGVTWSLSAAPSTRISLIRLAMALLYEYLNTIPCLLVKKAITTAYASASVSSGVNFTGSHFARLWCCLTERGFFLDEWHRRDRSSPKQQRLWRNLNCEVLCRTAVWLHASNYRTAVIICILCAVDQGPMMYNRRKQQLLSTSPNILIKIVLSKGFPPANEAFHPYGVDELAPNFSGIKHWFFHLFVTAYHCIHIELL